MLAGQPATPQLADGVVVPSEGAAAKSERAEEKANASACAGFDLDGLAHSDEVIGSNL